jgi:hypothetical protein
LSLRAAQLHCPTLRVASVRAHSMLHRMACLHVAQYGERHLIVVRILFVSSCCMINSFFPIDTCSSTESPVGPIP